MEERHAREAYESLFRIIDQLVVLSQQLQVECSEGNLVNVEDKLSQRQMLIERLQSEKVSLDEYLTVNPVLAERPNAVLLKSRFDEEVNRLLQSDTVLQLILERQGQKLVETLVERIRAITGIQNYQHTERTTDLVARIFLGNSRRFDENL